MHTSAQLCIDALMHNPHDERMADKPAFHHDFCAEKCNVGLGLTREKRKPLRKKLPLRPRWKKSIVCLSVAGQQAKFISAINCHKKRGSAKFFISVENSSNFSEKGDESRAKLRKTSLGLPQKN